MVMENINIPPEVVEAAARKYAYCAGYTWGSSGLDHDAIRSDAEMIIRAGLKAWPNAWINCDLEKFRQPATHLILPLPAMENNNAEA